MRAVIWPEIGRLEFSEWATPTIGADEVLVQVRFCGFCGTDPHIVEGRFPIGPPPQVLGHEVAGEIADVGASVRGWAVGDRVGCNLYAYCGACAWCRAGQPNHCRRKRFSAQGFSEYAVYRPEQLFRLPDDVGLDQGAFLEPVATCLHALDLSATRPGEHVLVMGGGPMGLILVQLAKLAGAASVSLSEPRAHARELASALGADAVYDPAVDDLSAVARSTGELRGFDVVFEAAGAAAALSSAPELVATRGRVVIVGVFPQETELAYRPYLLYEKEIAVLGAFATTRTFQRATDLLSRLALREMVTLVTPLESIADAYASHRAGEQVKILVAP